MVDLDFWNADDDVQNNLPNSPNLKNVISCMLSAQEEEDVIQVQPGLLIQKNLEKATLTVKSP